jgi:phosphocarrier protein HPr
MSWWREVSNAVIDRIHPGDAPMSEHGKVAERTLLIQNERGLHARAATKFVEQANKFSCEVTIAKDEQEVNGKSILGVLMLVAGQGSTVTVRARGDQSADAVAALAALINDKFGEGR